MGFLSFHIVNRDLVFFEDSEMNIILNPRKPLFNIAQVGILRVLLADESSVWCSYSATILVDELEEGFQRSTHRGLFFKVKSIVFLSLSVLLNFSFIIKSEHAKIILLLLVLFEQALVYLHDSDVPLVAF